MYDAVAQQAPGQSHRLSELCEIKEGAFVPYQIMQKSF